METICLGTLTTTQYLLSGAQELTFQDYMDTEMQN